MLQNFNKSLFNKNEKILIGLSGGADSVCLLLNFIEIKEEYNLFISAVHINHCLRDEESDRDEDFCKKLCEKYDIPLFVERYDVKKYCSDNGFSIEEGARKLRYNAFESHCNGGKIATAHTLSDNAETVLFNLARGTGLKGLCGIPLIRGNIIRPLLSVSRTEIEDYLKEKNQDYVTDSTNLSDKYSRNKIRLEVIPKLSEINSNFCSSVKNTSEILTEEEDYISNEAKKAFDFCRISHNELNFIKLLSYHNAIKRRVLKSFLKVNNIHFSYKRINEIFEGIEQNDYFKINLTLNVYLILKRGIISIVHLSSDISFEDNLIIGDNTFFNKKIEAILISKKNWLEQKNVHKKFAIYCLDYDKIQGDVVFRNRRNGDRISLEGKNFTSSLKKLMNKSIPLQERSGILILEDSVGIILAEKFGIAERVKIDDNTKQILQVTIKE